MKRGKTGTKTTNRVKGEKRGKTRCIKQQTKLCMQAGSTLIPSSKIDYQIPEK